MDSDSRNGYMGRVLEVDLSTGTIRSVDLDQRVRDLFIGGRALATALLFGQLARNSGRYENPIRDTEPLSEDNALVFCTSPTTGTNVPTSSRFHVAFKSPLTGGIGSSNSGGKWGVEFKRTGFDALIVTGRSSKPVILFIDERGVRLEDAPSMGMEDVDAVTDAVHAISDATYKVMTVGAAGRILSPIACIINDRGRALGRGGSGAVFGSKNLCAIAVRGHRQVITYNAEGLKQTNISGSVYKANAKLRLGKITKPKKQYGILSSMGTNGLMGMLAQYDELLHKNFIDNSHREEDLAQIQGEAFLRHPNVKVKQGACLKCPIGCTRITQIVGDNGEVIAGGEGPEFETVAMLGANLDIYDLKVVTEVNYLCNRYGFDTISVGGTIATLMEIYSIVSEKAASERTSEENALLRDTIEFASIHGAPRFGNSRCLVPLVETAAKGIGIGQSIALGARRLSERYGHPEVAMTVKGMELPAYDPRTTWTQALSYMVSPRGGCHLQGGYSAPLAFCAGYSEFPGNRVEGAALVVRNVCYQNYVYDTLGVCAFAGFSITLDELSSMLRDVTGEHYTGADLEQAARRGLIMERQFNHQVGFGRGDDWLPSRFFDHPVTVDGKEILCDSEAFIRMRREFYDSMGWDEEGLPTERTLNETGLDAFLRSFNDEETKGEGRF